MRLLLVALAISALFACVGHDPLTAGPGADGSPLPDAAPWVGHDAGPDALVTPDLRPDQPPLTLDLGRDLRPDLGSPDLGSGGSGLDRSRPVASLSDAELGLLCDWGLAQLGGYGTTMVCTDGTQIRNSPSRPACIAGHDRSFRCTATVADTEDCLREIARSGCSQALFATLPACRAMLTCQGA